MNDVTANQPKSSRRRWLTGVTVGTLLAGIAVWGANAWVPGERGFCLPAGMVTLAGPVCSMDPKPWKSG
jgi:hypothetical protein